MSSQVYEAPRQGLNVRQAETVEKLLAAGLDELREAGHEALTIRSVAQRANVSPATAYTYLASKNHLFAELFWRHLASDETAAVTGRTPVVRVQEAVRALTARIVQEPELAAAVTPALLGSSPDVERLRLRIGRIAVPEKVGNVTFGGPQRDTLFIAASSSLYRIVLRTRGVQAP